MIVFDLDGTLADCSHRRHFVIDPRVNGEWVEARCWESNWQAFYEACDKDILIKPVAEVFLAINYEPYKRNVEIWSGRCESVREKTINWIQCNIPEFEGMQYIDRILKMRPIGDYTPDDQLKERWLDEAMAEGKTIEFVIDDRTKVRKMWERRGIFVFDVSQGKGDF